MTNKDTTYIGIIVGITMVGIFGTYTLTEDHRIREEFYVKQIAELHDKAPPIPQIIIRVPEVTPKDTVGFENNNPCNVKKLFKGTWWGQIGVDNQGHVIFEHYSYSLRAAAKVLEKYQSRHKCKTLRKLFVRYIYAYGNEQRLREAYAYAKFMARRLHIGVDQEFDVKQYMPELLKGIIMYENGKQPYPDSAFVLAGVLGEYG